jgi:multidrug efflux pump subunit AcrA (membrane-fusion protein)
MSARGLCRRNLTGACSWPRATRSRTGQVLAQIDAEAQNAVVRQAMAALDAALIARNEARDTYDRSLALGGNVARSVLESEARAVQSAEQDVARLTAALEQAQVALRDHTIRAPIDGTILALDAEVGQIVDLATPPPDPRRSERSDRRGRCRRGLCDADRRRPARRAATGGRNRTRAMARVSFVSRRVDVADRRPCRQDRLR